MRTMSLFKLENHVKENYPKFRLYRDIFEVNFTSDNENKKITNKKDLITALQAFLDNHLNQENGADRAGIKIYNKAMNYPLCIEFRPITSISAELILNRFSRMQQSNASLELSHLNIAITYFKKRPTVSNN